MSQLVHKLSLFFIFLFLASFAYAYKAGEKLDVSYPNLVSVDYPCYIFNNSIYIYGNVSIGNNDCTIYYENYVEETTTSSSGSSGGGSIGLKCSSWGDCINNKTVRHCTIGKTNYTQSKNCISNNTTTKIIKEQIVQPIETIENMTINHTANITTINQTADKKSSNIVTILIIIGVIIILSIIGLIMYDYYWR